MTPLNAALVLLLLLIIPGLLTYFRADTREGRHRGAGADRQDSAHEVGGAFHPVRDVFLAGRSRKGGHALGNSKSHGQENKGKSDAADMMLTRLEALDQHVQHKETSAAT